MSERSGRRHLAYQLGKQAVALLVCGVSLYIVLPSLLTVFGAWPELGDVKPYWFVAIVVLESLSMVFLWLLLRISLATKNWTDVALSQLAGNAATRVIPGGAASGAVVQGGLLVRAGMDTGRVATALAACGLLTTGVLLALPVLAIPAAFLGPPLAHDLQLGLEFSLVVGALIVGLGYAMLKWDRFAGGAASLVGRLVALVRRKTTRERVAKRLLEERDQVASALDKRWIRALSSATASRMADYAVLVASLVAVGAQVRPSLVLVAYVAAMALGMVPITPGGVGIVEAGLTGLLVLAGVPSDQAVVGTLLYRLASFWFPIPVGLVAWLVARLRGPGAMAGRHLATNPGGAHA
jgi:uncharacterized protein (TIRG00374 family)